MARNIIDVACAIIWRDHRYLIVQRPKAKQDGGLWEFPGGKREAEEAWHQCLAREIREELALDIDIKGILAPSLVQRQERSLRLVGFLCLCPAEQEPVLKEHQSLLWSKPEDWQHRLWCEADLPLLACLERRAFQTHPWWL